MIQVSPQSTNMDESAQHHVLIERSLNLGAIDGQGKLDKSLRQARGGKEHWLGLAHLKFDIMIKETL